MTDRPTRRGLILSSGAILLAACARQRELDPVVIGGATVLPTMTIMEAIAASTDHRLLTDALRASGMDEPLSKAGPFTLLAPTDAAFEKIRPKADAERVNAPGAFRKLVLRGHIVPAKVSGADIAFGIDAGGAETKVLPLNGAPIEFREEDGETRAYDLRGRRARLGPTDAIASNGLIHVIDGVLLPAEEKPDRKEEDAAPAKG
jgi:uncharacterized surface protein with fasciclin (FAS1) repeats